MKIQFKEFTADSGKEVMDIFNYYIENTFAAFPENRLPNEAFPVLLNMAKGFPAFIMVDEDAGGRCAGFGFLKAYNPMPAFSHTAACTYFLHPEYTGKKIGQLLLSKLEEEAAGRGIKNLLAEISSENPGSIKFHARNGFTECGRFKNTGIKKGRNFDVIWMQKILSD